jgi:hypothetical protein
MLGVLALIHLPHTRLAIPDPAGLLPIAGPILAVAVMWWLVSRTDQIIHFLFPSLEWERSLGWFNIKAEKRALAAVRWMGYLIQFGLAGLLYLVVRLADTFPDLGDWPDPSITADLLVRIPALVACFGIWAIYLGCYVLPKIRTEREVAELNRFRTEMEATEKERELRTAKKRIDIDLPKPRTDSPLASSTPLRPRRRDLPGG